MLNVPYSSLVTGKGVMFGGNCFICFWLLKAEIFKVTHVTRPAA